MSNFRHDQRLDADAGGGEASPAADAMVCTHEHVVHSLPGRVRLRFPPSSRDHARSLAWRLSGHPAVHQVLWRESILSVTIYFDTGCGFGDILSTLPPDDGSSPAQLFEARRVDWGRVAISCLLSLLPLGTAGHLVLTLALELAKELQPTPITGYAPLAAGRPLGGQLPATMAMPLPAGD